MRIHNAFKLLFYCIIIIGNILYVDFLYNETWDFFNEENFTPTENFTTWYESKGEIGLVVLFASFVVAIIFLYIPLIWTCLKSVMLIVREFIPNKKTPITK
jgi:ABC-type phosphate transport system permease subunit